MIEDYDVTFHRLSDEDMQTIREMAKKNLEDFVAETNDPYVNEAMALLKDYMVLIGRWKA